MTEDEADVASKKRAPSGGLEASLKFLPGGHLDLAGKAYTAMRRAAILISTTKSFGPGA